MLRRVIAGVVLGLIVFGAATIVSHGLRNPHFLRPSSGDSSALQQVTATAARSY